jgi:hypothetical protein
MRIDTSTLGFCSSAYHPSTLVREFDQTGNATLHLTVWLLKLLLGASSPMLMHREELYPLFMPPMSKKKQAFIIDEDLSETLPRQTFTFRQQNSSSRLPDHILRAHDDPQPCRTPQKL